MFRFKPFGWLSNWLVNTFNQEREHNLNRARHKALYSKSGRIKQRRHTQRPPTRREQHK